MLSKLEDSDWGFVVYAPKTFRKGRRFPERITALQRFDQNALFAAFRFIPIGFTEVDPRISANSAVHPHRQCRPHKQDRPRAHRSKPFSEPADKAPYAWLHP